MTDTTVIGLENIGNTCFVNSMMQCFASLQSIEDFLQMPLSDSEEQGFLLLVQEELSRMKKAEGPSIWLKVELLYFIYFQILEKVFNSQQDISELMMQFFEHLKNVAPHIYLNFGVMATNSCTDGYNMYYTLNLSVSQESNSIDIGEKLSNAIFLDPEQVCTCGQQDRVHFYGDVPSCLIITVHKIAGFDRVNECEIIRRDVQIKCQPTLRINGQDYEMKSAVQYVGSTGKGGGIVKGIRKLLGIPKKSKAMKADEAARERLVEYRRAADEEVALSSPLKSEHLFEAECSPIPASSPPTPTELIHETDADSPVPVSRSIPTKPHVQFSSSPRNLPHMNNLAGHYTSYVKRGEDFYYISDADVMQTSVVKTDDLCVLFYERK